MADSPSLNSDHIVRMAVFSEGKALPDTVQIRSITVTRTINRIPTARLVVIDGDMPNQQFPVSDTDFFKPGATIRINAGYGDDEDTIFEGLVIKHGLQITDQDDACLVIECQDKAVKMTVGRKNANYIDMTDSDVITGLIGAHALTADVQSTTIQHNELVQYYCTDWDFLVGRAEANGLLVVVTDGHVAVKEPATSAAPSLNVSYGRDLITFRAEVDASSQYAKVQAVSWDMKNQAVLTGTEATPTALNAQGDLTSAMLADVLGLPSFRLQTSASLTSEELTQWAKAQQLKSSLARICGHMSFQGSAKAVVTGMIELEGVGKRFSGNVFATGLTHTIDNGNWTTEVQFGLSSQWFSEQADVTAPPAAGLLPAVEGLQTGVVTRLDGDPMGQHRVLVSVPVMQNTTEGVRARLLQLHGSSGFGTFFVPEVGDEVVLGYFNNDPSHPVILGSLYSSKQVPPYALVAENNVKAIVTRCQSKIEFNEEDKVITVTTRGNNKIVISDKGKSIQLHDQNDNKVELNSNGISLTSPKDITVSAKGKISLDAVGSVSITSAADILTAGLNVSSEAQVAFSAKGSATAELSAAGQTVVKGAMVMIN